MTEDREKGDLPICSQCEKGCVPTEWEWVGDDPLTHKIFCKTCIDENDAVTESLNKKCRLSQIVREKIYAAFPEEENKGDKVIWGTINPSKRVLSLDLAFRAMKANDDPLVVLKIMECATEAFREFIEKEKEN